MADFIKNLFGGGPASPSPVPHAADPDFADFAGAPDPSPAPLPAYTTTSTLAQAAGTTASATSSPSFGSSSTTLQDLPRPYTKWYMVWERVYLRDFYAELFIVPFLIVLVFFHFWGTRKNKAKAKAWLTAHAPVLQEEFASVGFSGRKTNIDSKVLLSDSIPEDVLKQKTAFEYITYATGRQNVAFVDIRLTLAKRYNPVARIAEEGLGFFIESMAAPKERMEAVMYVFDGKESDLTTPQLGSGEQKREKSNSSYDDFVFAIVHKDAMQYWRNSRYDLSLTTTRDHPKLPDWATIMSESAEITEALLTPDLIKAINDAGETLDALIISDQPVDKPQKLSDAVAKKRISLVTHLPSGSDASTYSNTVPIFAAFLRLPDVLVNVAHFRPEVTRRIRNTREEATKKMKRLDEDEKLEERRLKAEKDRKNDRDAKLKALNPEQQRKFLEKERALEMRRGQKKRKA